MFSKGQSSRESLRWALKTTHASKILRSVQFMLYPRTSERLEMGKIFTEWWLRMRPLSLFSEKQM